MKNFIAVVLFVALASVAYADSRGLKFTADGTSFPSGVDIDNTPEWDSAVSIPHAMTGIDSHEVGEDSCKVTISSGDDSLIDIGECHVHIQGPEYEFVNMTSIDPNFGVGENSVFIGITMSGYTTQTQGWSAEQKQTIAPLARLNTASGVTGPGSTVTLNRDDRYFVSERDYKDRLWTEDAIGALYAIGGELFSNATSGLVMGQYSGIIYNSQRERHMLGEFNNMSALFLHHTTTGAPVAVKAPFIVDNLQYDDGTGLVNLISQRWTKISVLKAPQGGGNGNQEGGWFYNYGGEYLTQATAEAADFDFSFFTSQGRSGLVPMAEIVVQQGGSTLGTDLFIIDKRACLVCRP
ncbi:hypothetical protein KAR91_16910 [Candidatus Pacearchaeota archaeon]|nr:hypothetical protein [Candidatus Pacearchaeota archaeon]